MIAGIGLVAWRATRPLPAGPVDVGAEDRVSFPFAPGETGSAAWIAIFNNGTKPAVVDAMRPIGVDPGMRIVAAYLVGKGRPSYGYCCSRRWPVTPKQYDGAYPTSMLHPPRGVEILPNRAFKKGEIMGATAVFAVRADRPGRYAFRGIELKYHIGSKHYRRVLTNAFTMCVSARPVSCPSKPGYSAEEAAKL